VDSARGKYLIQGTCKTKEGIGVEGCSVEIAGKGDLVYSDSKGEVEIRRRKNPVAKITVDPRAFVTATDSDLQGMPIEVVVA
jgi:hypothetical protein